MDSGDGGFDCDVVDCDDCTVRMLCKIVTILSIIMFRMDEMILSI